MAISKQGVGKPDHATMRPSGFLEPTLMFFSLNSEEVKTLARTKKKVTRKTRSGRTASCVVHKGERGGEFITVRKKGGGTRREYI